MFNNWWNDFDPLNYEKVKKNVQQINEKVLNFWRDFYNDIFKNIKKDEK
jgi:tetrahydromethanopterin S-methyltransferase subunit G